MHSTNTQDTVLSAIHKTKLFHGLTDQQLQDLLPYIKLVSYDPGAVIIEENAIPTELFVVCEGEAEVWKSPRDDDGKVLISKLKEGETIGEIGLLDELPRSAEVRAATPIKLISIAITELKALNDRQTNYKEILQQISQLVEKMQRQAAEPPTYLNLVSNLATILSNRIRFTTQLTADALKKELQHTKDRLAIGSFMIHVFLVIAIYLYAFKFVEHLTQDAVSTSLISIPLIIFFALAVISLMKNSNYPLSFYGITTHNWWQATWEGVVFSNPWILLIAILKLLIILLVPEFHGLHLIQLNLGARIVDESYSFGMHLALVIGYLIFTPLQELICRGGLQSSLQEFLIGRHKILVSVLMSNIFFSITHLFISFPLAMVVLLPGMFWGWMYARHRTLIGVCISHLLIGGMAFFVFDINSILQATRYF